MTERIRAVKCPSCGAPLELPGAYQRLFKCNFCGTTLEDLTPPRDQVTGQEPKIIIYASDDETAASSPTRFSVQASARLGCIIFSVILGITALSVLVPLLISGAITIAGFGLLSERNDPGIYSFGPTLLIPSDQGTNPDVVGVTSNSDDTDRMIYVDFDAENPLRWRSDPLGEGATYIYNQMIASERAVFMAYKTTLVAFDRADGTTLWMKETSDEVSNICQKCLQHFGSWVVTLTADGALTSYDAQNGEVAWTVRLNETTRQLLSLGGKIGVLDEEDGIVGIHLFEPATGERLQRIVPECPNETFPSSPQTLGVYDPVLLSMDGKNLYVPISDYEPACLQTYETSSMRLTGQASLPRDVLDRLDWEPYLLTDTTLYLSDSHNLYAVRLADGSYQLIYGDQDHNLIPIGAKDNLLLTIAERTRGTRKYLLWGLNTTNQTKLWELTPDAEDVLSENSLTVYQEGAWGTSTASEHPILFEAFTDPAVITFSLLQPQTGDTLSENTLQVQTIDYPYSMQVIGWQENQVYLALGASLWWIDANTGTELATWP